NSGSSSSSVDNSTANEHNPKKPFQRVDPTKVVYVNERLKDNTFESLGFSENHYTMKAHRDLIVTKGKGFTKEKNKKKRGSYKGGAIDFTTNSFKFTD
ncbi:hypothetical protein P167DRAFT_479498, partial [Morchella conica CCBAS932]